MNSKIMNKSDKVFDIVLNIIASCIILLVAYPLLFTVSASISNPMMVLNGEVLLLPKDIRFDAYKDLLEDKNLWLGYKNSIIYTVLGTAINLIMTTLAAYPLSRKTLPGRNKIMFFITFTMFFNGGMIPTYLLVRSLGLYNSIWAMVLPTAISTYNFIVMRTFFQTSIPEELLEAAEIDGCTNIGAFIKIVLPLSKPIIAVMVLFYGVSHWNAFFNALIYLRDRGLYPLQVFLRDILLLSKMQGEFDTFGMEEAIFKAESIKYSMIIVASLPVLILYPFIQKYFVKGIMLGALKG